MINVEQMLTPAPEDAARFVRLNIKKALLHFHRLCAICGISVFTVRFREKQIENAERDRMLADDPDHEEGEMYSGSDVEYDDSRRGSAGRHRGRGGSGKELVDARELIRESRRARTR